MPRALILLAVAIVSSLVAAGASARAAAPVHEWVPIDETFTIDYCGFDVVEHDVLTLHFVNWLDDDGDLRRRLILAPGARITYTNPDTGASVTAGNPFVVKRRANGDGTETISFSGLVFAIHGDGGTSYVDAGRDVIIFDPGTGDVEPVSSVGPSADLCDALAATIG
jgi:hypothetical protein